MTVKRQTKQRRSWYYARPPAYFGITCDKCGGVNMRWSEYAHMVWCDDCKRDTRGTPGVFGAPIALGAAQLLCICLDRIDMETGIRMTPVIVNGRMVWVPEAG